MTATVKKRKITGGQVALHIAVFLLCLLVLYPFALLIIKSLKDYDQEINAPVSLTFPLHFENYSTAWL